MTSFYRPVEYFLLIFMCVMASNASAQQVVLVPPIGDSPTLPSVGEDYQTDGYQDYQEEQPQVSADMQTLLDRLDALESQVEEELAKSKGSADKPPQDSKPKKKPWFEKYTFSGYTQLRINETLADRGPAPAQHFGDGGIGDNQSFAIRRARLVFAGDVNDHLSVYLQPDFASSVPGSADSNQFTQIRDWYGDIYFDADRVYRIRAGQSKVPYGWENLQSSRNRIPLDRNDAMNSAVKNERDLGVFFYYTPKYAQDFFDLVMDEGLKGSGNYGLFGVGFHNGQGGSFREQNDNLHFVTRYTAPITLNNGQMMELGIQAYTGKYVVLTSPISPLGVGGTAAPANDRNGIRDERVAVSFIYYPQPIGFQSEWNVGRGPGLNDAQTAVVDRSLYGGYVMSMYRHETEQFGEWLPFVRWSYFQGGFKSERNAPYADVDEWELGCEWQITDAVEFVSMYTWTDRTNVRSLSTANTRS